MKNKKSYTSNKAVIFARVSSIEQKDNNSLDAQVFKMKEYCTRKGFEIIKEIKLVESSTRGDRLQFHDMINFVRNQKEHVNVVVDAVDRLQRSFGEVPTIEQLRLSGNLSLHFLRENQVLDRKSNSAQLMAYHLFVLMAANFANAISDNVRRGFDEKRRKGEVLGHVPIGYLNKEKQVIVDEKRSILVKSLFEDYASELYSCKELAVKYGKLGLTNIKSEKYLSNSQVDRMISHPFYYGFIPDIDEEGNCIIREHKYPRFISKTLFDKCQEVKYKRGHNRYKVTKQPFTLKGLVKCKFCNCSYSPYIKKGHTYVKPNNAKTKCHVCKNISEELILKDLELEWQRIEIPKEVLEQKKSEIKKALESELKDRSIMESNLKSDLEKVKNQIRNWNLRCAEDLSITTKERQEFLEPLKIKETELELQVEDLNNGTYKFEVTLNSLLDLASCSYKLFKSSRIEEKREILKIIFSNIFLEGKKPVFSYAKPFDLFVKMGEFPEWSG